MTKPIFDAGDFELCKGELTEERMTQRAAHVANLKLSSLGIDAETPEKLRMYEEIKGWYKIAIRDATAAEKELKETKKHLWQLESALDRARLRQTILLDQVDLREKRLAELERMIAEAPVVYALPRDNAVTDRWYTTYHNVSDATHRARLVQIEQIIPQ